jgi:predicted metal-binding membrane protein
VTATRDALSKPSAAKVRLARFSACHPEWWVVTIAAGAWIALVLGVTDGTTGSGGTHSMPMPESGTTVNMSHSSMSWAMSAGALASMWMLMLPAMMLPVFVPRVRRVAASVIGTARQRSILQTLAGWLAVWTGVGVVVVAMAAVVPDVDVAARPVVSVLCWLPAVLWQFSLWKRRALIRCHGVAVPPGLDDGWKRVKAGARQTRWCAVSCGPAMATMALTGHSLVIMMTLTIGLLAERIGFRPGRIANRLGVGMVAVASITALLTIGA